MSFLNIEIKARCDNPEYIRQYLLLNNAEFRGTDEQSDTYFTVNNGRLKLREGKIENNLIFYERNNQAGPKSSHFNLVKIEDANGLKEVLTKACGIKVTVKKRREIYYISNVNVFVDLSKEQLQQQCEFYMKEFKISKEDQIEISYSDMLVLCKNQKTSAIEKDETF